MLFRKKNEQHQEGTQPAQEAKLPPRLGGVFSFMYQCVLSADFLYNSYHIESGELSLGQEKLETLGHYDAFLKRIAEGGNEDFLGKFARKSIVEQFSCGIMEVSSYFYIGNDAYHVRAERIPEPTGKLFRGILYIRRLSEGELRILQTENASTGETDKGNNPILAAVSKIYLSIYQFDLNLNMVVRLQFDGADLKPVGTPMSISTWLLEQKKLGIIHESSIPAFYRCVEKGFLEHETMDGNYQFESLIRPAGESEYRQCSETVIRAPGSYRKYIFLRRDVSEMLSGHDKRLENANRDQQYVYTKAMLGTMAGIVESRNIESGAHIFHVQELTRILLEDMAERSPQYNLTLSDINMYCEAVVVHDLGKAVIPDSILNKPGKLTKEEYELMKTHTTRGAEIVKKINLKQLRKLHEFCYDVALHHHERWDGRGYPDGLVGDEIMIGTQVIGLADSYDALVSQRVYKEAYSHKQAQEMIFTGQCGAFNPRLLESFKVCAKAMEQIYEPEQSEQEQMQEE